MITQSHDVLFFCSPSVTTTRVYCATMSDAQRNDAPAAASEEVIRDKEAGWKRRLVCDVVDSIVLSTLRAGAASYASRAAGFLAMLLAETVRICI